MKKSGLFILAASMLALVACGDQPSTSQPSSSTGGVTSSQTSSDKNSSESSKEPVKTYSVLYVANADYQITGLSKTGYAEGSTVSFHLEVANAKKELKSVQANDEVLDGNNGDYSFTMPARNVQIVVTLQDKVVEGKEVFFDEGNFGYGEETSLAKGKLAYWAGDGGEIKNTVKSGNNYSFDFTAGWAWYGGQIFYKLPYGEAGDSIHVKLNFVSPVAGKIQLNAQEKVIAIGENVLEYDVDGGATTISLQLGTNGGGALATGHYELKVVSIQDQTPGAKYHNVQFRSGETTLKNIEVKDQKTVAAPASPAAPEGKVFAGWKAGEVAWSETLAITKDYVFVPEFADASNTFTVTFKDGSTVLGTANPVKGQATQVPEGLAIPFGYKALGWYTDEALTKAFDLSTPVTADTTLYLKKCLAPTTWLNAAEAGWVIPADKQENLADGAYHIKDLEAWPAGSESWHIQVNFAPAPAGTTGKTVTISVDYQINGQGGVAQVFENTTIGEAKTLVSGSRQTATFSYAGGTLGKGSKLTFELGKVSGVTAIDFTIYSITVTEA